MKNYKQAEVEIVRISNSDVISTSVAAPTDQCYDPLSGTTKEVDIG